MERLNWLRTQWDRAGAVVAAAVGLVAIVAGWAGARESAYPAEQIPYLISGAILGVVLVGLGATAWLSGDLRDEWRKLDRLEEIMLVAGGAEPERLAAEERSEAIVAGGA